MAQTPQILAPREPFGSLELDGNGKPTGNVIISRSWWRYLNSNAELSGQLINPVTIAPNSVITPGTINSGSTVTLANSPPLTILGNSTNVPAPPEPQAVDPSLSFSNGTLAAASLPPGTLAGNPTAGVAPAGAISLGTDLVLNGTTLNVNAAGALSNMALAETIATWGM